MVVLDGRIQPELARDRVWIDLLLELESSIRRLFGT